MTGSMLIPNYLGTKTLLKIENDKATADNENALIDAKNTLNSEKRNPSVRNGNIIFLNNWIRLFIIEQEVKEDIESQKEETQKETKETKGV